MTKLGTVRFAKSNESVLPTLSISVGVDVTHAHV